jgi:hypothetical protein
MERPGRRYETFSRAGKLLPPVLKSSSARLEHANAIPAMRSRSLRRDH